MKTMNLKRQIRRLLALEWVSAFRPASAVWVLLLVHRGFSLAEIGLAEGIFHLVSLFGEVPSGVFSDLTGRKRALAMGQILLGLSAMTMLLSKSMAGICVGMAFSALGCNMASGTREAITYDSLLQAGGGGGLFNAVLQTKRHLPTGAGRRNPLRRIDRRRRLAGGLWRRCGPCGRGRGARARADGTGDQLCESAGRRIAHRAFSVTDP
ncbi:MAG: MFS transporter [Clostridia bacterium]